MMTKTKKEYTTLNKDGLAVSEGYFTVYSFSYSTGEYIGSDDVYLMSGLGIPAYSLPEAPPDVKDGNVAIEKDGLWLVREDHRGRTAYAKDGTGSITVNKPGDLDSDYTFDIPETPYDEWLDSEWVTDTDKLKTAQVAEATAKRDGFRAQADSAVVPLQDAVDLDEATEDETALLKKWKQYRVALNRLNLSVAPDITWPKTPEN